MSVDPHRGTVAVSIRDLRVRYGELVAVDGVSLDAPSRALTALVGPSGCGKTTLLRAVAGFENPVGGSIRINDRLVAGDGTVVPAERRRIGMVFQQGALFPHMTVADNVRYGVVREKDADARVRRALERVGGAHLASRYPDQLSGGQQQLAALARALAPSPAVILLDEPFANLDAALRGQMRDEVAAILHDAETTAILVTHDQEEALSLADHVAVMSHGRILQSGAPEEIYARPATPEIAAFIGGGQLLEGRVRAGRVDTVLGTLVCEGVEGPARVLARPEELRLAAADGPGISGRVVRRSFYGHDAMHEIELVSGDRLRARTLNASSWPAGSTVTVSLGVEATWLYPEDELKAPVVARPVVSPGATAP